MQVLRLGRGVEVFDLLLAAQVALITWQAAEDDGAAEADDGGAPAEAVGPRVEVVALVDQGLVELDGVNDQSDHLDNHCRHKDEGGRKVSVSVFSHANLADMSCFYQFISRRGSSAGSSRNQPWPPMTLSPVHCFLLLRTVKRPKRAAVFYIWPYVAQILQRAFIPASVTFEYKVLTCALLYHTH